MNKRIFAMGVIKEIRKQRLPIPKLDDTLERYLARLMPLQNTIEHRGTVSAVKESKETLKALDYTLRAYDNELAKIDYMTSYIEQFWYDSYLEYDDSVVLNVNPYFQLKDDPTMRGISLGVFGKHTVQVKRTSKLVTSILKFVQAIRHKTLVPDKVRDVELSMDQYERLFGSSRIPPPPGGNSCQLQTDSTSHHVVVMYKSRFYWFDVLDLNNEPIFSNPDQLEWNLYTIIMDGEREETSPTNCHWGALTTENTRVWSNIREHIAHAADKTNWNNLKIIDSALFIICLDDVEIWDETELVKCMLCGTSDVQYPSSDDLKAYTKKGIPMGIQQGTCLNRWYYKLQLIVTKNGKAGINFEHTGVDGHTVLRLVRDIYTDSILNFAQGVTKTVPKIFEDIPGKSKSFGTGRNTNLITIPRKLEWQLDSFLLSSMHFAETRLTDLLCQFEFAPLEFKGYGSDHIKSYFKTSPDAFLQMSFQVAYYALYGKFEMTYEPAMTKMFLNGRTEAIRTVSSESISFVKSMFDKNSTDKERIKLLHSASTHHSRITKECSAGQGQDRHLYALYCIWKHNFKDEQPLPAIFRDNGWKLLNTNVLSTSNCSNPCLKSFGFGPVCANGFGIGYIIRSDSLSLVITSRHRQTKRFASLIEKFLIEINRIFERAEAQPDSFKSVKRSNDFKYLTSGYDYFDISIIG